MGGRSGPVAESPTIPAARGDRAGILLLKCPGAPLADVDACDGRRCRDKRDTTPDALGFGVKREMLERLVADDPTRMSSAA